MKEEEIFKNPIAILVFIILIAVGGYFLFNNKNLDDAKVNEVSDNTQQEQIDVLKKELEDLKNQKPQTVVKEVEKPSTTTTIDVNTYLTGVAAVHCSNKESSWIGSGSLWKMDNKYFVLTNKHVIDDSMNCYVDVGQIGDEKIGGIFYLNTQNIRTWNSITDSAVLEITKAKFGFDSYFSAIPDLNYSISTMKFCTTTMPVGSPVMIIGYPMFAMASQNQKTPFRIITEGTISGHNPFTKNDGLPAPDYYVSAKMDGGNSGGIALSKDKDGLCLLGIPTWLSFGNYETQGMVQNIYNIMFVE